MNKLPLILMVAALPATAHAQRTEPPVGARYIGSFAVGVHRLDVAEFNNAVSSKYPSVNSNMVAVGGSGFTVRGRLLFGVSGTALAMKRQQTANRSYYTRFSGGHGTFNLGYAAVDHKGLLIYPMAGLGVGGIHYAITPTAATTFANVVNNPARSTTMNTVSMAIALRAGLNYDFASRRRGRPKGPSVGVQAGYVFAPLRGAWRGAENIEVVDGPHVTVAGPELMVTVGGWHVPLR